MPLPAQLRNQLGGMLDAVYDARAAGTPYQDNVRIDYGGRTIKLRVIYDPSRSDELQAYLIWKPVPGA